MQDLRTRVSRLRRPATLIRAAKAAAKNYAREKLLRRIFSDDSELPKTGPAILRLLELEAETNQLRKCRNPEYSASRHLEIIVALRGETADLDPR